MKAKSVFSYLLLVSALLIAGSFFEPSRAAFGIDPAVLEDDKDALPSGEGGDLRQMPIFVAPVQNAQGVTKSSVYFEMRFRVSSERLSNVVYDKRFKFQAAFLKACLKYNIASDETGLDIDLVKAKMVLLKAARSVMGRDVVRDILITGYKMVPNT